MANNNYGLKFPFSSDSEDKTLLDLNSTKKDAIRGKLIHLITTPKGNRLRMPEFGTDIIKYIFSQNDEITWDNIKNEISQQISKYIKNVSLTDIELARDADDDNNIYIILNILYDFGIIKESDEIKIKL